MTTVVNLMGLKDYYMAIMRWMVVDQLIKGYYTPADERLRCICQCEIEECDKALADCTHKAIADEIRSEIFKILSH